MYKFYEKIFYEKLLTKKVFLNNKMTEEITQEKLFNIKDLMDYQKLFNH